MKYKGKRTTVKKITQQIRRIRKYVHVKHRDVTLEMVYYFHFGDQRNCTLKSEALHKLNFFIHIFTVQLNIIGCNSNLLISPLCPVVSYYAAFGN